MKRLLRRHRYWERMVDEAVDGFLDERARERLGRHLARCRRCATDLEELQAVRAVVRVLPAPQLPRSFILSAVPDVRSPRASASHRWRVAAVAAQGVAIAAAVAFATLLTMYVLGGERTTPAADVAEGAVPALGVAKVEGEPGSGDGGPTEPMPSETVAVRTATAEPGTTPHPTATAEVVAAGDATPIAGGYVGPPIPPEQRDTGAAGGGPGAEAGTPTVVPDHRVEGAPTPGPSASPRSALAERPVPLTYVLGSGVLALAATALSFALWRRPGR